MNNTTQHDTTRHHMGAYTLGHHLWVAGEQYLRDAQVALDEKMGWLAETMLTQAEQAFTWSNALQAGSITESLDDLVGVDVENVDAWVRSERVAMLWALARGENLPQHRNDVVGAPDSPTASPDVSRETLGGGIPPSHAPADKLEDMENTYQPTATAEATTSDLLTSLIASLTKTIVQQVRDEMESIAESAVQDWADGHDFASEVTDSYDFRSAVCDVVNDLSFSITVD